MLEINLEQHFPQTRRSHDRIWQKLVLQQKLLFVVVGKHPKPNVYCIKPVNGSAPDWTVNRCQLQDLGKTQNDVMEGLTSPQDNHDGAQVPSFNPKLMNIKSPPNSHPYAIHSKGRPPVHSLGTTAGMGSSRLRPGQPQRVTTCSSVLANLSGFRTMPECAGPGVVHFLLFIYLWATSGTGIIILFLSFSFLSPYLAQVDPCFEEGSSGVGLSNQKGHNDLCVASLDDSKNHNRGFPHAWEASLQQAPCLRLSVERMLTDITFLVED